MTQRTCIVLMLRSPRPGEVKTRLARDIGHEAALAVYKACVEDMLEALAGCGADLNVWVAPGGDVERVRQWLGDGPRLLPQPEGDLGARMRHAFEWAFGQGYAAAAALGSDLPGLTPRTARALARLLRSEPAFIGPSPDGGYWTIGFQAGSFPPEAFEAMPWGTPDVFALTERILSPLQPALLPEMADLDTLEDLLMLMENCPPGAARRTLAAAGRALPPGSRPRRS